MWKPGCNGRTEPLHYIAELHSSCIEITIVFVINNQILNHILLPLPCLGNRILLQGSMVNEDKPLQLLHQGASRVGHGRERQNC